jgi:O-antigen/teichoic acid export membrane protein
MNRSAQVAYRVASDVAAKGAFFVVTVIAARRLSLEDFGVFSIGTTLGWMAAVASDFGIQMHLARSIAHGGQRAADVLAVWLRVRAVTSAVVIVVAAAIAALTTPGGGTLAILLITIAYVAAGLVESVNYFYRGLGRTDIESTLTIVQRGALLLIAALALSLSPTVTALGVAMVIPPAAMLAYSVARAGTLAASTGAGGIATTTPIDVRGELLREVLPIGAGIVLSAFYFRIDVLLLQLWNGTDAVATYNAVFRIVDGLRLVPAALVAVALPVLCRATTLQPLLRTSAIATGAAIAISAVLWAIADAVVPLLFGGGYAGGVPAFRILLLAFPLMSLNHALTCQLIGWHGHRAYAATCAAALLFNVAANAALLPAYGSVGAAWTTVATEVVMTLGSIGALIPRSARAARLVGRGPQADPVGAF